MVVRETSDKAMALGLPVEAVLETARPRLLRLARLRGVPADTTEDIVQETLLEAWRSLDRLYDVAGIHRWLDEICRNVCRRHARKHATEERHAQPRTLDAYEDGAFGASRLDVVADNDLDDPVEALSRQELMLLLDRALGLLPEPAREALEVHYLRELPQREAMDRLGLSLSALEARLYRARRDLRRLFNGPLRADAEAFGWLTLEDESAQGWHETRLWCTVCGRRLSGILLPQLGGGVNLHLRCRDCEQRSGLNDIDSSTVHSKGLSALGGLRSFRPAWKRTMQDTARRYTQALLAGAFRCPFCAAPARLELVDKAQIAALPPGKTLPDGLGRHPYRFWVWWQCCERQDDPGEHGGLFAASDLVYWSHVESQRFLRDHPHCISDPELLIDYAGQPALRLQLADTTSAARLTMVADRQTLRVLAVFA
jgi:RNA polymerase sigma factor (sigma-70 family)